MKNEPVLTYNHMDDDSRVANGNGEIQSHPISLYLILFVDVLLMGVVIFVAFRSMF